MASHLIILPILLPLFAGLLILLEARQRLWLRRLTGLLATAVLVPVALLLWLQAASGEITVYRLGNWAPPFGIVLVLDQLAALMLAVTALLALPVYLHACRGDDQNGANFHALFQFQLLGINGAFLTGDLFNLFVFFEVLLIASYALLMHGQGADRARAGIHYVVLNLTGSSLFLFGLGLVYAATGTLNMADVSRALQQCGFTDVASGQRRAVAAGIFPESGFAAAKFLVARRIFGSKRIGGCVVCHYDQGRPVRDLAALAIAVWA